MESLHVSATRIGTKNTGSAGIPAGRAWDHRELPARMLALPVHGKVCATYTCPTVHAEPPVDCCLKKAVVRCGKIRFSVPQKSAIYELEYLPSPRIGPSH